ncbi:hypothetical protein Micbo1qcDRAFT_175498 [Microdochium bolleyi]|uniref:Uncharacterized protein n=1 Tax=Microdochium bolleyi TaxID=196109 RepID=A0A136J285_9PEZI|nr:hypothetical protein Micbo1qcDRAFT_175498 [Microdochium bolleyi]
MEAARGLHNAARHSIVLHNPFDTRGDQGFVDARQRPPSIVYSRASYDAYYMTDEDPELSWSQRLLVSMKPHSIGARRRPDDVATYRGQDSSWWTVARPMLVAGSISAFAIAELSIASVVGLGVIPQVDVDKMVGIRRSATLDSYLDKVHGQADEGNNFILGWLTSSKCKARRVRVVVPRHLQECLASLLSMIRGLLPREEYIRPLRRSRWQSDGIGY